jgi:hypothetical protein
MSVAREESDEDDDDILRPVDVPGTIAAIKAVLAGWYKLTDEEARWSLTWDDDGVYYLNNDGKVRHEETADQLPYMLSFVKSMDDFVFGRQRSEGINGASTTNSPSRRRGRPLSPEVTERRRRITEMAERFQPASIRQLYYQAEVAGLVPKTDNGYRRVQHDILILRQQAEIDYDWISDNTRWMRKSDSYKGIDHFLHLSINTYRRDLWHDAPVYVEIWIEKDALAGTIMSETDPYDVPLMVARGFSSETYLYEAAQAITYKNKPAYIYAFFDHDPSGEHSAKHIERKLREFAPGAEIHFELVAVTEEQIEEWELPTRETKREGNRHAKSFEGDSCELDSIPPDRLRDLVRACIMRHIDPARLAVLQAAEESERAALKMFAQSWKAP